MLVSIQSTVRMKKTIGHTILYPLDSLLQKNSKNPCKHHFEAINNMYLVTYSISISLSSAWKLLLIHFSLISSFFHDQFFILSFCASRLFLCLVKQQQSIDTTFSAEIWCAEQLCRTKNKWNENENKHSTNHLKITFNWTEYVNRILFAAAWYTDVCLCVCFPTLFHQQCICGAGDEDWRSLFFIQFHEKKISSKPRWLKCNDIILCFDMCIIIGVFFWLRIAKKKNEKKNANDTALNIFIDQKSLQRKME